MLVEEPDPAAENRRLSLREDELPEQDGHLHRQRLEADGHLAGEAASLGGHHRGEAEAEGESVEVFEVVWKDTKVNFLTFSGLPISLTECCRNHPKVWSG